MTIDYIDEPDHFGRFGWKQDGVRYMLDPGELGPDGFVPRKLGSLPPEVRAVASEAWTPSVIAAWTTDLITRAEEAVSPPAPEFPILMPDQFWFGLRLAGYEDDVRAFIASLNDPESPAYDPIAWASASAKLEFATFFERDHPLVEAAREAIGLPEAELDALWKFAAG